MTKTWRAGKARIKQDIAEAHKHFEAVTAERHRVIGLDKPLEYREQIIDATCLMIQARDLLDYANGYKPSAGKPWESEGALRNYRYNKKESDNKYRQYLELKDKIIKSWPFSSEIVVRDIKEAYKAAI